MKVKSYFSSINQTKRSKNNCSQSIPTFDWFQIAFYFFPSFGNRMKIKLSEDVHFQINRFGLTSKVLVAHLMEIQKHRFITFPFCGLQQTGDRMWTWHELYRELHANSHFIRRQKQNQVNQWVNVSHHISNQANNKSGRTIPFSVYFHDVSDIADDKQTKSRMK